MDASKIYFGDEMGVLQNESLRYGRSPKGERVYDYAPNSPGKRTSIACVIGPHGVVAANSIIGHYNQDTYEDFIEDDVIGEIPRGSTLYLDNASVHKGEYLYEILHKAGIELMFIPSHTPKLNPAEPVWMKMRPMIQRAEPRTLDEVKNAAVHAWHSITPSDCEAFYKHAGYSSVN